MVQKNDMSNEMLLSLLEKRFSVIDKRFSVLEKQIVELRNDLQTQITENHRELRGDIRAIYSRQDSLESAVHANGVALDTLLEGDTLGKKHITFTRPEYDKTMDVIDMPNRFVANT
jgi:hypothetical protein